ncbi:xanthine dehydrogenase family protein molybdopterin-binding subunit [Acidianus ambivalens]|uniref:Molybdopterin-dependent oxidoreductase n=2 Tax=Acidianus TaxID=12914 RepID=A0A650CWK4_ACIAM|nr:molybdopterin cofactor-binding domain-containing protein [Acidianus ambivalens]MQL54410.1 molybdopterin-dependent oxidoreductase [Acidianus ambivalens]QGR22231.1 molybdopterin-dependent oxidoreductase [Acidianus ambivalens]
MGWTINYVDDITIDGNYEYVAFIRSQLKHAKFSIAGKAFTYEDLKEFKIPTVYDKSSLRIPDVPLLPKYKAVYKFQPLGIVIGNDRYDAFDKIEEVEVNYEPYEGPVYEEVPDNIIFKDGNGKGEVSSENEFNLRVDFNRNAPYSMETRIVAVKNQGDQLIIHLSTQIPTVVKMLVSEMLEIPQNRISIIVPNVGGGFGLKQDVNYEELSVIALAYKLNKNLKWVETRTENVMTSQARDQTHELRVGYRNSGKLDYVVDKITYDAGAYLLPFTGISPLFVTLGTMKSLYDFELYYDAIVKVSNKPPQGAYRGFGRPEAILVMERIMDEISKRTKISPIEVRKINVKRKLEGDVGDVNAVIDKLSKKYEELRRIYGKGIGISLYVQYAAPNSEIMVKHEKSLIPGYECVRARLDLDGWIIIETTLTNQGQRMDNSIRKIVSKELGYDKIKVELGKTNINGYGVWASRSMLTAGNAAILAVRKLKEIAKKIDDNLDWEKIARIMRQEPWKLKELSVEECYETPEFVGTVSGQIVVVNKDELGNVKPLYNYIIADVGITGDDEVVKGQLMGGALQAISGSFLENTEDEIEYSIATIAEAPKFEIELLHTPSNTPSGVRGVGENSISGGYAAFINAINDLGLECNKVPCRLSK